MDVGGVTKLIKWKNEKADTKGKEPGRLQLCGVAGVAIKEPHEQNQVSLKIFGLVIIYQLLHEEKKEKIMPP